MSLKNKESNKQYLTMLALYLIMFINEAYMHYEVYVTNYTPFACGMALYYWGMDVTIILLFFYSVTIGRRKLAFILSYCFINIFVLANIGYSRFLTNTLILTYWANLLIFKVHGGLPIYHKRFDGAIYYSS